MRAETQQTRSALAVDHLPPDARALEVRLLDHATFGSATADGIREPHRHDYHELIWTRSGRGRHLIDGDPAEVVAGAVTVIGRGQVHVFERAEDVSGAVVRFGDEVLYDGSSSRADPSWLLGARGARTVTVPPAEVARFEAAIESLAAESRRPLDARGIDLQRHLLLVLFLWIERWWDAARTQQRDAGDAELQLYRRFLTVLDRDFASHHDTGHYADALAVPPAALSRSLSHVTGRTTKQLIGDRVMLEAARLLRFTDMQIGEVAHRAGFEDQLYFSRAFRRHYGEAPSAYRERLRGAA